MTPLIFCLPAFIMRYFVEAPLVTGLNKVDPKATPNIVAHLTHQLVLVATRGV